MMLLLRNFFLCIPAVKKYCGNTDHISKAKFNVCGSRNSININMEDHNDQFFLVRKNTQTI